MGIRREESSAACVLHREASPLIRIRSRPRRLTSLELSLIFLESTSTRLYGPSERTPSCDVRTTVGVSPFVLTA